MIAWTAKWSSINLSLTEPAGTRPVPALPPADPIYCETGTEFFGNVAKLGGAVYELLRKYESHDWKTSKKINLFKWEGQKQGTQPINICFNDQNVF